MRRYLFFGAAGLLAAYGLLLLASEIYQANDCWSGYGQIVHLRSLCAAQEEFQRTDADKNGSHDYWRKDVAGLYGLAPAGTPLQFIELHTAQSDHDPQVALAQKGDSNTWYGWWLGCLGFADEKAPDPKRFAFCAWPERPEVGSWVFIVSQDAVVYGKELASRQRPPHYPADPQKESWLTLDQIRAQRWKARHPMAWVQFWRD